MQDFVEYVIGLFRDWKSDFLWGVVIVISLIYHKFTAHPVPDGVMLAAIAGCFFFASYRAYMRDRAPKLTAVQIERRKSIKEKYDAHCEEARAILRTIAVDGSIPEPMLHIQSPRFWWELVQQGLVEEKDKRWFIPERIYQDVLAVIDEEIRASQTAASNSSNSQT